MTGRTEAIPSTAAAQVEKGVLTSDNHARRCAWFFQPRWLDTACQDWLRPSAMTREDLFAFIQAHPLAVLSSVSSEGTPQSALVGISVTPKLEIIFDTVRTSRKYPNLIANPAAAFVVGSTTEQTLQYEGLACQLEGEELAHYQAVYFAAWPDGRERKNWPGICYFAVKPQWIRFSDYAVTPALIEEFRFTA